jgi:hypothetical protein
VAGQEFPYGAGKVFTYSLNNSSWVYGQVLSVPGDTTANAFGNAMSMDSNTLLVGAPLDQSLGTQAGNVYVYSQENGVWNYEDQLIRDNIQSFDSFGSSVSLHGASAVIGAPGGTRHRGGKHAILLKKMVNGLKSFCSSLITFHRVDILAAQWQYTTTRSLWQHPESILTAVNVREWYMFSNK